MTSPRLDPAEALIGALALILVTIGALFGIAILVTLARVIWWLL